jgi:hypothetical protein
MIIQRFFERLDARLAANGSSAPRYASMVSMAFAGRVKFRAAGSRMHIRRPGTRA